MAQQTLDFYFDYSSPYGYFASEMVEALAEKHGRVVVWKPILLGAIFKQEGTQSLVSYPMKGPYSKYDIERSSGFYNIPFQWPPVFPVLTVNAARATLWVQQEYPEKAVSLIHVVFRKAFAEGTDVAQVVPVLEAAEAVGLNSDEVAAVIRSQPMKDLLKSETQAAMDRGVFGSPFFFIEGERFWGVDRMDMMDAWMTRGGW